MRYIEDDHGSHVAVPVDGSPPGSTELVLRGQFSMVAYHDRHRPSEVRLVLSGHVPGNRKLVYGGSDLADLQVVQDSPGMAKEWDR